MMLVPAPLARENHWGQRVLNIAKKTMNALAPRPHRAPAPTPCPMRPLLLALVLALVALQAPDSAAFAVGGPVHCAAGKYKHCARSCSCYR